jgi:hypothetical protein
MGGRLHLCYPISGCNTFRRGSVSLSDDCGQEGHTLVKVKGDRALRGITIGELARGERANLYGQECEVTT